MAQIESIVIENSGAISNLSINLPFTSEGLPKPLIIVGENGSGKTTALSFIVDSMLQLAAIKFNDIFTTTGAGTLFYRLHTHDVRIGSTSSVSYIKYRDEDFVAEYIDRAGSEDVVDIQRRLGISVEMRLNATEKFEKKFTPNAEKIALKMPKDVYAFFPSGRKETPSWLQEKALQKNGFTTQEKFSDQLNKQIVIETGIDEAVTWILDCLLDKAAGHQSTGMDSANKILQKILLDPFAHFAIAPRQVRPRVQIYSTIEEVRQLIVPSLGHLSAGQSMLLSIFATIANHGTHSAYKPLEDVSGIVIIDEAELYLHTNFQRTVLPELIKFFPKVQFIITTHSPVFLMGMKDCFGVDGFEIREMPSGAVIDVDQFGEIGAAVESLRQSKAFKSQVSAEIARENNLPILVVEGRTDRVIIEALWKKFKGEVLPFRIICAHGDKQLSALLQDEQFLEEAGTNQRVLGLFDFDDSFNTWNGCKNYGSYEGDDLTGTLRRNKTHQNVCIGLLPVCRNRASQAGVRFGGKSCFSIEMYLPDAILQRNNNLSKVEHPGGGFISSFQGDKAAFADRVSGNAEMLENFDKNLLKFIESVLIDT